MVDVSESRAENEVPEVPAEPSPDASSSSGPAGGDEVSTENSTEVSTKTSVTPDEDAASEGAADGDIPGGDTTTSETTASETPGTDAADTEASAGAEAPSGASATPARLTFRITPISLLAVLTVAICVTPVAWYQPWLLALYLLPAVLLGWVLRVRTVVTADSITATALRRTRIPWGDVRSVKLDERRWIRAVLDSGKEVLLPAVRVRDLSRLAAMSGGRLPDPAPPR